METYKMRKKIIMLPKIFFLVLVAIMLLTISGCAGGNYVWYQAGTDKVTFKKDNLECEEESALYAKHLDKRGNEGVISERMKECMGLRGYDKVLEENLPAGANKF